MNNKEFRVRDTGVVLNEIELRLYIEQKYPGKMMPAILDAEALSKVGVDPVLPTPQPAFSSFQTIARDGVVKDALGNWVQKWKLVDWDRPLIDSYKASSKIQMWEKIKTHRDKLRQEGFLVGDHWFHSDTDSMIKHLANKDTARDQLANGSSLSDPLADETTGAPIVWKTMTQTWVPLTCQLAFDVVRLGKSFELAMHKAAEIHRSQMVASSDPFKYDYVTNGWPLTYEAYKRQQS